MSRRRPTISASEIGQFVYCPRTWWLTRVAGCEPDDLAALISGVEMHRRHGRAVGRALVSQRLALALIGLGFLAGLIALGLALGVRGAL